MRIARKRRAGLMVLALTAALLAGALVGCSGGDEEAMVQAGGDFVAALVTADGAALLTLVPPSVAEEHPEYADAEPLVDGFTITQEWDGDALVLSAEADGELMEEAYRLSAAETDNTVTMLAAGEEIVLTMEKTDDGWIVTHMDGEPVDGILSTMLLTSDMDADSELDE